MARVIWRDLAVVAFVGLAVRVVLIVIVDNWGMPRLWEYDAIARNILAGRGFVYDYYGTEYLAFTTPGWPYVLALLLYVGDYRLVQAVQILACMLLGTGVYLVVRSLWGRWAGLLAGVLCVLQPGLVYYSVVNSDPLPLNALVVFLLAVALLRVWRHATPASAAMAGGLIGVSILTRGTTILLLPVATVWLLFSVGGRQAVRSMTIIVVVTGALITPWILRNWSSLGTPIMTSTSGEMFWWGNNAAASGGIDALDGTPMRNGTPTDVVNTLAVSQDEVVHDQAFRQRALAYIWNDPAAFVRLSMTKFTQFWWFGPFSGKEYPSWFLAAYRPLYAAELVLAMAGVVVTLRSRQRTAAWLLVTTPLAISLFQSLFYVQGRHRWMVESFAIAFAAVAAAHFMQRDLRGTDECL